MSSRVLYFSFDDGFIDKINIITCIHLYTTVQDENNKKKLLKN
jgi:hypothetical protein